MWSSRPDEILTLGPVAPIAVAGGDVVVTGTRRGPVLRVPVVELRRALAASD